MAPGPVLEIRHKSLIIINKYIIRDGALKTGIALAHLFHKFKKTFMGIFKEALPWIKINLRICWKIRKV